MQHNLFFAEDEVDPLKPWEMFSNASVGERDSTPLVLPPMNSQFNKKKLAHRNAIHLPPNPTLPLIENNILYRVAHKINGEHYHHTKKIIRMVIPKLPKEEVKPKILVTKPKKVATVSERENMQRLTRLFTVERKRKQTSRKEFAIVVEHSAKHLGGLPSHPYYAENNQISIGSIKPSPIQRERISTSSSSLQMINQIPTDLNLSLSSSIMALHHTANLLEIIVFGDDPESRENLLRMNLKLKNGSSMPAMGFGTYRLNNSEVENLVYEAIKIGYRHIDTASVYRNEEGVGRGIQKAIAQGIIDRNDIFLTTKIAPKDQGYEKALAAIKSSTELLGTFIDLILLHWPGTQKLKPSNEQNKINRLESIRAMKDAYHSGLVKTYGVSNFNAKHLKDIDLSELTVNQFEMHPLQWKCQKDTIEICQQNGIVIEAYSSLGEGNLLSTDYPEIVEVSKRCGGSCAQVLLSWGISKGFVVIPKTSSVERMKENWQAQFLKLSQQDVDILDSLSDKYGSIKYCWDPELII